METVVQSRPWRDHVNKPLNNPQGLLEEFGINITDIARRGDIDPVIGRDEENHSRHQKF